MTDCPWIFHGTGTQRQCDAAMIIFQVAQLLPEQCKYHCWKVQIELESLAGLGELNRYLIKKPWLSKCGIDRRDYTSGWFAGYIYCDSEKEAREKGKTLLHEFNAPFKAKVVRGCTEFRDHMPSDIREETPDYGGGYRVKQSHNEGMAIIENWYYWTKLREDTQ
jgi:hypothetical protein